MKEETFELIEKFDDLDYSLGVQLFNHNSKQCANEKTLNL